MTSHNPPSEYDVVVVGARVAGATTAMALARAGRRVLLVDRDRFPSDTVSTHQLFPNTLALLDEMGVTERLRARHRLHPVRYSWRVLGHAAAGSFTPVGGHDRSVSIRRVALDVVLQEAAEAAGATLRLGAKVVDLVGSGSSGDPVRGIVLDDGSTVHAPWVIGADGRRSFVARRAGATTQRTLRGEMSMLVAYWEGLPPTDWCHIDVHEDVALQSSPCEDGLHLLSVTGGPSFTRGSAEDRQERYLAALRRFPAVLNPRLLVSARQVTQVVAAPETMLRGHVRQASGPGWALVGDAGLATHPSTGQGIGDAVAQGWYVGQSLASDGDLSDYEAWRDERARDHLEFSFRAGVFPGPDAAARHSGLEGDPPATQEFLDTFTKRVRPSAVLTPERRARWKAAWIYETGLAELLDLVQTLSEDDLARTVPACPDWSVRDLLAHLAGVAADSSRGRFFAGAMDAWRDPSTAEARERWTQTHVADHESDTRGQLARMLDCHGSELVAGMRRGETPVGTGASWGWSAPVGDLAVHVADLREALGHPPQPRAALTRWGFASYRSWLDQRLRQSELPALQLVDGDEQWVLGPGSPAGSVTAPAYELFRMISGRRSERRIRDASWSTDPGTFLPVLSPYPLPE